MQKTTQILKYIRERNKLNETRTTTPDSQGVVGKHKS
jgi:hypothetical protein